MKKNVAHTTTISDGVYIYIYTRDVSNAIRAYIVR